MNEIQSQGDPIDREGLREIRVLSYPGRVTPLSLTKTREVPKNMLTMPNQGSTPKRAESSVAKTAYVEIALRTATSRIDALEKELHEMQSIIADHERRRHEAESKACIAQRNAQDLEIRFSISDKRRKDAENKTRELEIQITDAVSLAQQSEVLGREPSAGEANRFDRIREVFDNQAFEESKKRVDAEHRAHEVMKKRAEAEAKCLEETERRVQAEVRAKQEMRIRIDEEMRNKALRSKLRDAEEKLKMFELQKSISLNFQKRKKAEAEDTLKTKLKQVHQSLSQAEQKRKEAELKETELEQLISSADARALECEKKIYDRNSRVAELQMCLDNARAEFERKEEYSSRQLEQSTQCVAELQMMLDNVGFPSLVKSSKGSFCIGRPPEYVTALQAISAQQMNYLKLGELQTLNADLEVTIRELKENVSRNKEDDLKIFNLLSLNAQLEATVEELKQRLEQEDHAKIQLHATIDELEDSVREQTRKLDQMKAFENSTECRRLGDSMIALRVEENPLFRPEPVAGDLQRDFLSRPDSVTDDSQMSPRERSQSMACKSKQVSCTSSATVTSDSEVNLMGSPKSDTEDGDDCLYHQEKQSLSQKLNQNEALITELRGTVQEGHTKQSELEFELKEALECRDAAEIKADELMSQLELALQREKERDKEYSDLSGTTTCTGKKEKWGILDRFRSKIKLDNVQSQQ